MASAPALDMGKLQTFAFTAVGDVTAQQMGPLSTVGDRLGLFNVLASSGPVTSGQFAEQAGINERYGREWLPQWLATATSRTMTQRSSLRSRRSMPLCSRTKKARSI